MKKEKSLFFISCSGSSNIKQHVGMLIMEIVETLHLNQQKASSNQNSIQKLLMKELQLKGGTLKYALVAASPIQWYFH